MCGWVLIFMDWSNDMKKLTAYFTAAEHSDVDAVSSASVVTVNGEAKGCVQAIAEKNWSIIQNTDHRSN